MATLVLVHGAFQGGWVWHRVAKSLCALGHEVHAPTLSGCGYLADGLREGTGLQTYIQDICNYLHYQDLQDVVLVAHSYSGMVCTGVATRLPLLVRRQIFVDAVIPEAGRSFADLAGEAFRAMLENHRAGGWRTSPWPLPVFGVPEQKSPWFRARLRDFPEAAFTDRLRDRCETVSMSAAFIECTRTANAFIRAMPEKAKALGWPVFSLDSNHSPMTSDPDGLARLLHEACMDTKTTP